MISDWGEVVTRYPYGNVRMDHLLSKEKKSFSILLVMFLHELINNAFVAQLGEHLLCTQGVKGSNPLFSTNHGSGKRRESELNGAVKPVQRKANKKPRMHIEN